MDQILYKIECDSDCGFMVRSHNKDEVGKMAMGHVKEEHGKDISETEIDKMIMEV